MKLLFSIKVITLLVTLALLESIFSNLNLGILASSAFRMLFYLLLYLFSYYVCNLGNKGSLILIILIGTVNVLTIFTNLAWVEVAMFWVLFNFALYKILEKYPNLNRIIYILLFVVLNLKILLSVTISHWDLRGFVEFIQTFISQNFANPWEYYSLNPANINAQLPADTLITPKITFPYPSGMLYLLTSFSLETSVLWNFTNPNTSNFLSLFSIRIPVIMADLLILNLILNWIKITKYSPNLSILWFLSPIVGISAYLHGQLDLIPTALFCLTVELIRQERLKLSVVILTIGYVVKSYFSLIVLPFIFYLGNFWGKTKAKEKIEIILLPIVIVILSLLPFGFSNGYQEIISNQVARNTILEGLKIPIGQWNTFPLSVAAIIVFYLIIISNIHKINDWLKFMFVFGSILILVPSLTTSSIAWFTWALPAVTVFYITKSKREFLGVFPLIAFSIFYSLYFLGWQYSSFWFSFTELKEMFPEIFTMKIASWSSAKFISSGTAEVKPAAFQLSSIILTTMNTTGLYIAVHMLLSFLSDKKIKKDFQAY